MPRLRSRPLILESRKYLAASYLFLGRRELAETQFEKLVQEDPNYELDPVAFPKDVLEAFARVRQHLKLREEKQKARYAEAERERLKSENARRALERERFRRLIRLATTETLEERNSRWLAMLPFGVGQFRNGHRRLGITLAIGESLLAALSLTSFLLHASLVNEQPDSVDEAQRVERGYRVTNWVTTGLFFATAAGGIIDAQVRFKPVLRFERRRNLEPGLLPKMELQMSATQWRLKF